MTKELIEKLEAFLYLDNVTPQEQADSECQGEKIQSGEEYAVEPYKAFFDALWIAYCNQDLQFEDADFIITVACKNGLVKEEKYNPDVHGEALGNEWGLENGDSCYVLGKKPTPNPVKVSLTDCAKAIAGVSWRSKCTTHEAARAILDELIKQGINIQYD